MVDKKPSKKPYKTLEFNAEHGKLPPQATDIEVIVLGALMVEKEAINQIIDILKPDSFYDDKHRLIYEAVVKLNETLRPIDMLTVTEELRKMGSLDIIGGAYYITQLASSVASAAHIQFHARIIQQKYIQRELIRVTSDIQEKAYDMAADVDDLLDYSEKELFNIAQGNIKREVNSINDILLESTRLIQEAGKRDDGLSGVPCGFTGLDRVTSGWQRSDMIVIAARPSMGKTAFVLSMMRNIAVDHNIPCAMFSLEMSSVQLVNRLIIGETGIPSEKIKTGKLTAAEWVQFEYKLKGLSSAPIYIDDTPGISIFEFRAKCRRLKSMYNIELVIVDYLQLMSGSGGNQSREQEVSAISRGLKAVAKELNIPVIALSQLNRQVETRGGDHRPMVSDLRESGAIEQDADIIMFIHRPERFGITTDADGNPTKGKAELIIAKHRNGATCDVSLKFISDQAKFTDPDDDGDFGGYSVTPVAEGVGANGSDGKTFRSKMNMHQTSSGAGEIKPNNDFDIKPGNSSDAPF